jgi:hypothetical protein
MSKASAAAAVAAAEKLCENRRPTLYTLQIAVDFLKSL